VLKRSFKIPKNLAYNAVGKHEKVNKNCVFLNLTAEEKPRDDFLPVQHNFSCLAIPDRETWRHD
jgi:hypothetical protein